MRTVKVGDRDVTVEEPSIYKTRLIGRKFAEVGRDAPEIQIELAKFVARYEKENAVVLDRPSAMTRVPHLVGKLSDEDWKAGGNQVRLPRTPSGTEQVLAILPTVFTKAEAQALDIAALLIAPNSELEDEGSIDKVLKAQRQFLNHHAKPSELLGLLAACTDVIKEVIEAHKDEVGKLRSFWAGINREEEQPTNEHDAALQEVKETLGETGTSPASTGSQPDTDGDTETSPIESQPATSSRS
jgi:hypothetical protein